MRENVEEVVVSIYNIVHIEQTNRVQSSSPYRITPPRRPPHGC